MIDVVSSPDASPLREMAELFEVVVVAAVIRKYSRG
jgi:hypothetical protein